MQYRLTVKILSLFCAASFLALPAQAASVDPLIEGAKLCTRHLPRYEREYGIPTHLLSAIASTESGRYHEGLKIALPWPWTINAEGKGYYFNNKDEAINAVRKLRARGVQSIDVGCMQVNLHHHANAFASLDQAFEPEANIAYAASFLRSLYQEENSWKKAAADYHSKTPSRGSEYAGTVYNSWYKIIEKLRAARLQVPSYAEMADAAKPAPYITRVTPVSNTARLPEQGGRTVAARQAPRMNTIELSKKDTSRENGIIVVRPEIKVVNDAPAPTPAVALAAASPMVMEPAGSSDAKIIRVDNTRVVHTSASAPRKQGPTFIFSD